MGDRAAGEAPPVIRNRLGASCQPVVGTSPMAGGGNFQNPPTRPFGCLHNIVHLGFHVRGREAKAGGLKDILASALNRLEPEQSGVTERSRT